MGRKSNRKFSNVIDKTTKTEPEMKIKKLSPQKRNELNQLVEKLHKATTTFLSPGPVNFKKIMDDHCNMYKILIKIIKIESELNVPLPQSNANSDTEFLTWLENNGADLEGVGIAQFPGYRYGLRALRDMAEGKTTIRIPRRLMITHDSIKSSLLQNLAAKDPMIKSMDNVALSLLLLLERFKTHKSFWTPYFNMLPAEYTTVLYFTPEELAELKGSPALESALSQFRNITRQYTYFYKLFLNNTDPASEVLRNSFTFEQYRWATSTVMTRQNYIPSTETSSLIVALIPMWDMANHSNGKISTSFNVDQDCCDCVLWRDFIAGEQVFIFYGARSNADFLIHNGFVYPQNTHDSVRIRLGVSKSDPLESNKNLLLQKLGIPSPADFSVLKGSQPIDGKLLAFLRIFSMDKEQLSEWVDHENITDLMQMDCKLDPALENKAWLFLQARIDLLINLYPTSIEEDEALLNTKLSERMVMVVQFRLSEKRILQAVHSYIDKRINS